MWGRVKLRAYIARHHIGLIAIVIAVVGMPTAWAVGRNSIGAKQIQPDAVGPSELRSNSVGAAEVRRDSLTSADIDEDTLEPGSDAVGFTEVTVRSTSGVTEASSSNTDIVMCEPGEVAVGGSLDTPEDPSAPPDRPFPANGTPIGWEMPYWNPLRAAPYTLYVLCAS